MLKVIARRSMTTTFAVRTKTIRAMSSAPPHGGVLKNLMVSGQGEADNVVKGTNRTLELNDRQSCDVELLINGGFSPLEGPMNRETYDHVVENMRLPESGLIFGLPVVFDTDDDLIVAGDSVLMTFRGKNIAVLNVEDKFEPNKPKEVLECYGTSSLEHPGVQMVAMERGKYYLGGSITGLDLPERVFPCKTPAEVRDSLPSKHGKDVVAFQCRNPVHRAHYELFMRALDAPNVNKDDDAVVLVHPTCGPTQADDISGEVRYKTYEVLKDQLNDDTVQWAYLPYSMHMAGPREAIQHMMIRKNYGCTHFIIGRDMAGSKSCLSGEDFYGPYDAQDFAKKHSEELGMKTVPSLNLVYTEEHDYITADKAEELGVKPVKLSGTEFRRRLRAGEDIPEWFAFKSVVDVLREAQGC